ncbi:D-alanyl-D-alanine carboxypeptidase [Rhizobiales bacterium]|uniref:D-alanyl-D-alanine carboxypeptidase family protein n=1 Tax=Hongsoonwoonella zoysiae TaxID=2821844 RepID=UPI001560336F|nr:D-alanyl-D-alanine carboxypeptidase family protein [Hongsoonwoonella zoysiae]NRG18801.1 D-alanyl-D-alanine carboxypeptidase [Hongsoonwoonella zoysiae]
MLQTGLLAMTFFLHPPASAEEGAEKTSTYLLDTTTETLLSATDPERPFPPASTAKLMTAAVVFKALEEGKLKLSTTFKVSEHAWRTGGAPARTATMFAELGSEIRVEDLLRGLIIQNANDAAIVIAEGMAGSEADFADLMNELAREIGLRNTRFANPTGYEAEGAHTSARDLAVLANYILDEFPQFYYLYSLPEFTWNNIFQRNRNPVLGEIRELDGMVSGFSETDGFNAVGSTVRGDRRFVAVVAGAPSESARIDALKRLLDSVEKDFEEVILYDAWEPVADARTFGGTKSGVALAAEAPVRVLLPRGDRHDYKIRVVYRGPLIAPVEKGQKAGELRILKNDVVTYRTSLVTMDRVEEGTMRTKALDSVTETLFGWW